MVTYGKLLSYDELLSYGELQGAAGANDAFNEVFPLSE